MKMTYILAIIAKDQKPIIWLLILLLNDFNSTWNDFYTSQYQRPIDGLDLTKSSRICVCNDGLKWSQRQVKPNKTEPNNLETEYF